jgi:hypothetical protein
MVDNPSYYTSKYPKEKEPSPHKNPAPRSPRRHRSHSSIAKIVTLVLAEVLSFTHSSYVPHAFYGIDCNYLVHIAKGLSSNIFATCLFMVKNTGRGRLKHIVINIVHQCIT